MLFGFMTFKVIEQTISENLVFAMFCPKADTWTLLGDIINSIFMFEWDEFDGWGVEGDALTTGVVEHILRYYEVQGDYQMLSTIVCVLTLGRDRRKLSKSRCKGADVGGDCRYQLLPKFDERRYDNYFHRYAALLYGWGVLTVRNEISKRLAFGIPGAGAEIVTQVDTRFSGSNYVKSSKPTIISNPGVAPGVTFTPLCPRCMEPVTDADVCQICKDYAFQCSICCSAVRGLCTWCPLCGHGGHVNHIIPWFRRHEKCPTGCGCVCMLDKPQFANFQNG